MKVRYMLGIFRTGIYMAGVCLLASSGIAQERAAGSALENQMTWSALKTIVDDANARTAGLDTKLKQVEKCNEVFKVWAPKKGGHDANGCIDNELIVNLGKRVTDLDGRLEQVSDKLDKLDEFSRAAIKRIDKEIDGLDGRIEKLSGKVDGIDERTKQLEKKMDAVDLALASLNSKLDKLNGRVTTLTSRTVVLEKDMAAVKLDIDALDKSIRELIQDIVILEGEVQDNAFDIAKIMDCGSKGKVYNYKTDKCEIAATATVEQVNTYRWLDTGSKVQSDPLGFGANTVRFAEALPASEAMCKFTVGTICTKQGTKCWKLAGSKQIRSGSSNNEHIRWEHTFSRGTCN